MFVTILKQRIFLNSHVHYFIHLKGSLKHLVWSTQDILLLHLYSTDVQQTRAKDVTGLAKIPMAVLNTVMNLWPQ
jgi:hypothetical protein